MRTPNVEWIVRGLWLELVGFAFAAAFGYATGHPAWIERGPEIATVLAAGCALTFVRARPRLAAWIAITSAWAQLTYNVYRGGSFVNVAVAVYPVLIAASGLFLGGRGALWVGFSVCVTLPLSVFLGGTPASSLVADGGREGLWLLVVSLCNISAAVLSYSAIKSYSVVLDSALRERSKYRRLFAESPDGLIVAGADGLILEANEAAGRLLRRSRDALGGRRLGDLLAEESGVPAADAWGAVRELRLRELRLRPAEGAETVLEISAEAQAAEDGERLIVLRDISQRKLIEQRLDHAQRMEAVGQLAGGIAHDFNNLLLAIGASAELLAQSTDTEARAAAKLIGEAQKRAKALTQSLLAFARKDRHQPANTDLAGLTRNLAKLIERVLGEQCRLRLVRLEAVAASVDPAQLEQVALNLASNARDAMPRGGELRVSVRALERGESHDLGSKLQSEHQAMIEFADDGEGIPLALQQRIFEPFFTTKPRGKGTGLGLAAVQGIVTQNQGFLALQSRPAAGACFRIFFPAVNAGNRPPTTTAADPEAEPAAGRGRGGDGEGRILLVDDEAIVRESIAHMLGRAGFSVVEAANADEALNRLDSAGPFALMITDLAMPGRSGRELAALAQNRHPDLPVVFMSGYFNEMAAPGAAKSDDTFLSKPFSHEQLLHAVRSNVARDGQTAPRSGQS